MEQKNNATDELLVTLQRAIDEAEHKPGTWAGTRFSMGGICDKPEPPLAICNMDEKPWGSFSFKRDSWLAVAAVNALPELMERLRGAEAEVARLRERLEIDERHPYDGIACRDETIKGLQERVDQLKDLAIAGADSVIATLGSQAVRDVLAERRRQVEVERWTPEHDDGHVGADLARASAAYAIASATQTEGYNVKRPPLLWPWDKAWWKPCDARRSLVKSVALGIAELERMDRAEAKAEARIDVIGQNGNGGEHYEDGPGEEDGPWSGSWEARSGGLPGDFSWDEAPEWADKFGRIGIGKYAVFYSDTQYQYAEGLQPGAAFRFDAAHTNAYTRGDVELIATRPAAQGRDATQG